MKHPRLDTKLGIEQQKRNIERSKERLEAKTDWTDIPAVACGGDNFEFVSFEDVTDLKLWER